jgi:hypothetical protein
MQSVPDIEQDFSINGNTTVLSFLSLTIQGRLVFTERIREPDLGNERSCVDLEGDDQRGREAGLSGINIYSYNRTCFINSRSGLVVKFVLAMHEPRVRFTAATFVLSSDVLLSFEHVFLMIAPVSGRYRGWSWQLICSSNKGIRCINHTHHLCFTYTRGSFSRKRHHQIMFINSDIHIYTV